MWGRVILGRGTSLNNGLETGSESSFSADLMFHLSVQDLHAHLPSVNTWPVYGIWMSVTISLNSGMT